MDAASNVAGTCAHTPHAARALNAASRTLFPGFTATSNRYTAVPGIGYGLFRVSGAARHLPKQPGARRLPFPLDAGGRELHDFGRFFDGEPREEAQFHDSPL